ncbi:LytR/AlgR family response regulator transcription factor [Tunicatimonas pelagia]|uniref:LytR/AlgR family response regulator transcription factor n=1 Tax=Tunicatimonas pelagia TaxID=931531 RepID=UPI0026666FC7|nr:LytTR family DNA-binding domain-containing protein [Tunicatimonas pelagia]WKN42235.1 LytTR family DNA-binding domain-containing protein [Tunicatimonas pelagia]
MIRAIAIDDEPNALRVIENHAAQVPFLQLVETFTDPFKALKFLEENSAHLIFLDINMPDISGLELSSILNEKNVLVIFTTAFSEYALESYDLDAVDYLLKPFEFTRFHSALLKVRKRLNSSNHATNFFFVNTGSEQRKMRYEDIQYIEGSGNYVTYHLSSEKVLVRSTIKQVRAYLPSAEFIQVQRSYIVALSHIDVIRDNHIHIGQARISIGPKYKEQVKSVVNDFS